MKMISTESEYEAIMARIDELVEVVDDNTSKSSKEYVELNILTDIVVVYEKEHYKIEKPSLVDVIKLRMYEMNLTQKKLAEMLDVSPSRVSEILSGKSEPTYQIARGLSKNLNIDAEIVLDV